MLRPGHRIGNYEVQALLGDGGMAMVYRARHGAMGTNHAVKVLLPNYAQQPRTVERFRLEARAQFRLRHPNIVQVTDYVDDADAPALVMDLIEGMTLRQAMDKKPGPWALDDVLAVMLPVLEGMAFVHREGLDGAAVVHRDLKPENILLDLGDGKAWPGVPKIADFGIAKVMGSANIGTKTNARMGTAPYMSPEQFRDAKDVDARADVWALGMMLWEMLAGKLPVNPNDNIALIKLYEAMVAVPRLDELDPRVPRELAGAVAQAMSVGLDGRFRDAGPLLRVMGELGRARVRRVEMPPPPTVAVVVAAPVVVPVVAAKPVPVQRAPTATPPEPRPAHVGAIEEQLAQKSSGAKWALGAGAAVVAVVIAFVVASSAEKAPRLVEVGAVPDVGPAAPVPTIAPPHAHEVKPELPAPSVVPSPPAVAPQARDFAAKTYEQVEAMPTFDGDVARFADNGDGTVTDKRLELMWQQADSAKDLTWAKAKRYCGGLGLAKQTGWRLPTIG
ncbi:MAG: DUF1566 domain-containing protein, partial [Myxococcales bacterium]|nr:DUF1566 domain-containing protein [Myxococcales bacterium]